MDTNHGRWLIKTDTILLILDGVHGHHPSVKTARSGYHPYLRACPLATHFSVAIWK